MEHLGEKLQNKWNKWSAIAPGSSVLILQLAGIIILILGIASALAMIFGVGSLGLLLLFIFCCVLGVALIVISDFLNGNLSLLIKIKDIFD